MKKMPETIYGTVKPKRKKKTGLITLIILVVLIVAGTYFFLHRQMSQQYTALSSTLYFTDKPVRIKETAKRIDTGDSVKEGDTILVPLDDDRVIFTIGSDITVRLLGGSQVKFNVMKLHKKENRQIIEINLQKGAVWVTKTRDTDSVTIHHPAAVVKLGSSARAEFKTTPADSLEIYCWEGDLSIIPPVQKDEPIELGSPKYTIIKKTNAMLVPREIQALDMNIWEAWNLQTNLERILKRDIPTFEEALAVQREQYKVVGGFTEGLELKAETRIDGKRNHNEWQEGGASANGRLIMSWREFSFRTFSSDMVVLEIEVRNDGDAKSQDVAARVTLLDKKGNEIANKTVLVRDLEPAGTEKVSFNVENVAGATDYRINFMFPR